MVEQRPSLQGALSCVRLARTHLQNDDAFALSVDLSLTVLGIQLIDFANELAVSVSTVERWRNGRSVPYPTMRKPVYAVLERRLNAAISGSLV